MRLLNTLRCVVNAYAAWCWWIVSSPFMRKKHALWLIGGHHGRLYADNAKAMHQYMHRHKDRIQTVWVASLASPYYRRISPVVALGSVRGYLAFLRADVVMFSNTLNSDIAPYAFVLPLIRRRYRRIFKVYLGHGTAVLKKMPPSSRWLRGLKHAVFASYDLAIASVPMENDILQRYGIRPDRIVLAGSARNDRLKNAVSLEKPLILIAPTWRTWLKGKALDKSEFYRAYRALLTHPQLLALLRRNRARVAFYLHHMFHEYIDLFKPLTSAHIEIVSEFAALDELIAQAAMLITDYSSVCADFYALNKPVLFYHFDVDDFLRFTGSEIDLKHTPIGPMAYDADGVIAAVEKLFANRFAVTKLQQTGETYFVYFRDRNNCQRIFDTIIQKRYAHES